MLASIEQGAEGEHALDEQIVADAWADEQACATRRWSRAPSPTPSPRARRSPRSPTCDFDGDARAAAIDLSLADGRFAPDVLEVAARRAVARLGRGRRRRRRARCRRSRTPRRSVSCCTPATRAADAARRPRPEGQADPDRRHSTPAAKPPTMSIEVDLTGRRYIEDRDTTAVLAGSRSRATSFTEHWTFALDGDAAQPWLLDRRRRARSRRPSAASSAASRPR